MSKIKYNANQPKLSKNDEYFWCVWIQLRIFHFIMDLTYSRSNIGCKIKFYEFFVVSLTTSFVMLFLFLGDSIIFFAWKSCIFSCKFYKNASILPNKIIWANHFKGYDNISYEMVEHMNKLFSWSHVAAVLFCAHLILSDVNWFYMNYEECNFIQCLVSVIFIFI